MAWELVAKIAVTCIGALVGLGIAFGGIWLIDLIGGRFADPKAIRRVHHKSER